MCWRRRLYLALAVSTLAAFVAAPSALAGPAEPPVETATISLEQSDTPANFGKPIALRGTITPAAAGVEVALLRRDGSGKSLSTATTTAEGAFVLKVSLKQPASLVAHAAAIDATSAPVEVAIKPKLTVRVGKAAAFADATAKITVQPADAVGTATLVIKRNGKTVQRTRTRVRSGRASEKLVAPGPGAYVVAVEFDAPAGYAKASAKTTAKATTRTLKTGASGRDVAGLIRRLRTLNFHVPSPSMSFSPSLTDAVIAFQKVTGLPRTGVVGQADWQAMAKVQPVKATRKGPPNRIEVDKTRQILIKVRGGAVVGVLPVSTGATGNTPEGVHNIRWKAPSSTTWLGPGILYRTLTFFGNTFAIHGWESVPAYPASHGCVRVPIWTADWLYERSPVGETVIVHR